MYVSCITLNYIFRVPIKYIEYQYGRHNFELVRVYSFLQHSVLFSQKFSSRPEPEPEEDYITCQKAKILERPNILLKKY
jgi:hypothetical protein